jgi:hypothetical protein
MRVPKLQANVGRQWVAQGFGLLRRAAIPLLFITMLYLLVLVTAAAIPLVGAFAPLILTPALSVGMMHAARAADQHKTPTPQMLLRGFRDNGGQAWKPLLILGVLNAASTILALGLSAIADGGVLVEIATGQISADDPRLGEAPLLWSISLFLLLYTPVQMALWYAPMFAAWHAIAPLKALFFSLVAVARNKAAFFQYGLAWMGVALLASVLIQVLRLVLGNSPWLISLVLSPISLIVLTALYCSFWPSYRDVVMVDPAPDTAPN